MTEHNWGHRFVSRLLDERLGGSSPPDVRQRVHARLRQRSLRRNLLRVAGGVLAAAAALVMVAGVRQWTASPGPSAEPVSPGMRIEGAYTVADGGALRRGAQVWASKNGATLFLEPHVRVVMEPETALTVGDADGQEEIYLSEGTVECRVQKGHGGFRVKTDLGTVSVVGTEFTVELTKELTEMNVRQMVVSVLAGAVLVAGPTGETMVKAGEKKVVTAAKPGKAVAMPGRIFGRSAGNGEGLMTMERNRQGALMISSSVLQDKLDDMQQKALESETVAAAHKNAVDGEEAYRELLSKNDKVKALNEEKEKLEAQRKDIQRPDHRDREAWREFHKEFADLHKEINAKRQAMYELIMNDPELAKAREKAEETWLAFLDEYMAALEKMDGYAELLEQIEQRQSWLRESWQEQAYEQRMQREKERNEAEAKRDAERKKNIPEDKVDVDPAETF